MCVMQATPSVEGSGVYSNKICPSGMQLTVLWLVAYLHKSMQNNLSIIVNPTDSHTSNVLPKKKQKKNAAAICNTHVILFPPPPQNPGEGTQKCGW